MKNFISLNLKYLRSVENLDQEMAGKEVGVSKDSWSSYERDKSQPKIETLQRISERFGYNIDDLINKDVSQLPPVAKNQAAEPGQAYKKGAGDGIAGLIAEAVAEKLNPSIQKIDQLTELLAEGEFLLQMQKMRKSLLEEKKGATHSS